MPILKLHIHYFIIITFCFCIWGCSSDYSDEMLVDNARKASVYLSLQINAGDKSTRSYPTGGEYGDDLENGNNHENAIEKLEIGRAHV